MVLILRLADVVGIAEPADLSQTALFLGFVHVGHEIILRIMSVGNPVLGFPIDSDVENIGNTNVRRSNTGKQDAVV